VTVLVKGDVLAEETGPGSRDVLIESRIGDVETGEIAGRCDDWRMRGRGRQSCETRHCAVEVVGLGCPSSPAYSQVNRTRARNLECVSGEMPQKQSHAPLAMQTALR